MDHGCGLHSITIRVLRILRSGDFEKLKSLAALSVDYFFVDSALGLGKMKSLVLILKQEHERGSWEKKGGGGAV